jgi:hypothetical protein
MKNAPGGGIRAGASKSSDRNTEKLHFTEAARPAQAHQITTRPQASSSASAALGNGGVLIASFWKSPRNRSEAIQIALKSYEGHAYLDARVYATDAGGRMVPTSRGIAVGVKTLAQFTKAIGDGYRKAAQMGLITAASS